MQGGRARGHHPDELLEAIAAALGGKTTTERVTGTVVATTDGIASTKIGESSVTAHRDATAIGETSETETATVIETASKIGICVGTGSV